MPRIIHPAHCPACRVSKRKLYRYLALHETWLAQQLAGMVATPTVGEWTRRVVQLIASPQSEAYGMLAMRRAGVGTHELRMHFPTRLPFKIMVRPNGVFHRLCLDKAAIWANTPCAGQPGTQNL